MRNKTGHSYVGLVSFYIGMHTSICLMLVWKILTLLTNAPVCQTPMILALGKDPFKRLRNLQNTHQKPQTERESARKKSLRLEPRLFRRFRHVSTWGCLTENERNLLNGLQRPQVWKRTELDGRSASCWLFPTKELCSEDERHCHSMDRVYIIW